MKIFAAVVIFLAFVATPTLSLAHTEHNTYEDAGWSFVAGMGFDVDGHISINSAFRFQYPRYSSLSSNAEA